MSFRPGGRLKASGTELEGGTDERRAGPGRHAQGRVRPHARTASAKRWDVERPALRGLGDLPRQGLARRPEPALRLADQRLVRPGHPALRRRRQDLGAGRQQVRLRRRARHAPVVRRHAAPVGVQARLAPRAVARPTPTPSTPASRTPPCSARPTAARPGRSSPACARHGIGPALAAGRRRHVPAHDHPRPDAIPSGSSSPSRPRARSAPTTAAQTWRPINQRPALRGHPRPGRRGRPLRAPHRHAPVAPERAVHAEALGRHAQRRRRRHLARGQRQPADRLRLPDRRARPRAGDRSTSCRSRATPSTSRPTASCASTAAAPAATSGSR